MNLRLLLFVLPLAACAGAPDPPVQGQKDPELKKHFQELVKKDSERHDYNRGLIMLDQLMSSYAKALGYRGDGAKDREAEKVERHIQALVKEHYDALKVTAADAAVPANQGIALAALGFSGQTEAMPIILQGAQLGDPFLVDRAVFGLAMLSDPETPPGVLMQIAEDSKRSEESRAQATWTLYRLQGATTHPEPVIEFWQQLLQPKDPPLPPSVLLSAIRGLGFTHDAKYADIVARYVTHPTPQLRIGAATALGRMNAQKYAEALLALLGPAELNANVRLAAHHALKALAGGVDRGYDVDAWRKTFQRDG